jgi:hypothetical protein
MLEGWRLYGFIAALFLVNMLTVTNVHEDFFKHLSYVSSLTPSSTSSSPSSSSSSSSNHDLYANDDPILPHSSSPSSPPPSNTITKGSGSGSSGSAGATLCPVVYEWLGEALLPRQAPYVPEDEMSVCKDQRLKRRVRTHAVTVKRVVEEIGRREPLTRKCVNFGAGSLNGGYFDVTLPLFLEMNFTGLLIEGYSNPDYMFRRDAAIAEI